MESIHQRIRRLRKAKGLTQEQLAAAAGGIRYQSVQEWEREGGTAPSRKRLEQVAKALGTTAAYLIGLSPTPDVGKALQGRNILHSPNVPYRTEVDVSLLKAAIEGIELHLAEFKKKATPAKKAELIVIAYGHLQTLGKADAGAVKRTLRLIVR